MPKIELDKEARILSIRFSKRKSVDSHIQENVVVDFDKGGNVVNIEIMNFSLKEFKPLLKEKFSLPSLSQLERVK